MKQKTAETIKDHLIVFMDLTLTLSETATDLLQAIVLQAVL